jgi:hypothetical protein
MSDLILPKDNGDYDMAADVAAFNTELVAVIRNHPRLHIATMIGVMEMLCGDLHHNAISNIQQEQMAQAALARAQETRIKRGIQ